jgi:branched-chain amino acid transport system permease protein
MMTQITAAQAAILAINSLALGGLLFLLSSGFSLIFGLMRIPNLMHGSFFMLGAYFGVTLLGWGTNFWLAAVLSGLGVAAIGGVIERLLLRRLEGQVLPQVLLTLGFAFIIADVCLMVWTGDPWQPSPPCRRSACSFRSIAWRSLASQS